MLSFQLNRRVFDFFNTKHDWFVSIYFICWCW
jgi:hypothetical protein